MPQLSPEQWNDFLTHFPDAHILQTETWGRLKGNFGWTAVRIAAPKNEEGVQTGVQILFRQLPLGFSLAYIPRGPLGPDWHSLWQEIDEICKTRRAIFLKIEPDQWQQEMELDGCTTPPSGFQISSHEIQPPRTLIVDLRGTPDQILAKMKQKTRYNIRLAGRKGVVIRESQDIDTFYQMIQVTGERDAFEVHSLEYYRQAFDLFYPAGNCTLFIAEYNDQPLAGIMVFSNGRRAWYFYGASTNQNRQLMPTYLLQWKSIQWAKLQGCLEYDLWGVPDEKLQVLEDQFLDRKDGLWGVYRFKRGFGGELRRVVQAWDRIYLPFLYKVYLWRVK